MLQRIRMCFFASEIFSLCVLLCSQLRVNVFVWKTLSVVLCRKTQRREERSSET